MKIELTPIQREIIITQEKGEQLLKSILPEDISILRDIFVSNGFKLYLVGGAVRDALLGSEPKDFDLATDATPQEITDMLNDHLYQMNQQGAAFGVVVVYTETEPNGYEIATFREDLTQGRHPEVKIGSTIEKDVLRRDLTINALFYDLQHETIIDLVDGIHDLIIGFINTVGEPTERFEEDRLRIMRAVRFAARYGSLAYHVRDVIKANPSLDGVSRERIYDEFIKGLKQAKKPKKYIGLLNELGLLEIIFPGYELYTREIINHRNPLIQLVSLLRNADTNVYKKLTEDFKFPLDISNQAKAIRRFLDCKDIVSEAFNLYTELQKYNVKSNDLIDSVLYTTSDNGDEDEILHLALTMAEYKPTISGNDLMAEGFKGKEIGIEKARRESILFKSLL